MTDDPVRVWQRRMDRLMLLPTERLCEIVSDALLILSVRDTEQRSEAELGAELGRAGVEHPGHGMMQRMVADRQSVIREYTR